MTDNPSKTWAFTLNNYTPKDIQQLKDLSKTYLVFGQEVGVEGTPHLQGMITFSKASRLSALKKINSRIHWEPAKSAEALANYCIKDQDYYIEDNRTQGTRTDLRAAAELVTKSGIKAVAEQMPEAYIRYHNGISMYRQVTQKPRTFKPNVIWVYGPTGSGKTRSITEITGVDNTWMSLSTLRWWDGYENQDNVIFDDFRGDFCTFHELLRILDRYPYTVQVKGGTRIFNSKNIFITSCMHPREVYHQRDDRGNSQCREDVGQLIRRIDHILYCTSYLFFFQKLKSILTINGEEVAGEEVYKVDKEALSQGSATTSKEHGD